MTYVTLGAMEITRGFLLLASFSRILTRRARWGKEGEPDDKKNFVFMALGKTDYGGGYYCLRLILTWGAGLAAGT
jgi:hypothetical protein